MNRLKISAIIFVYEHFLPLLLCFKDLVEDKIIDFTCRKLNTESQSEQANISTFFLVILNIPGRLLSFGLFRLFFHRGFSYRT